MAAHERCSQLGKLCEIFAGCSSYFLLGWVVDERACLFNWIWFRWPIPSSLIWESSGFWLFCRRSHLIFHGLGCVMLLQLTICKECCVFDCLQLGSIE